MQTIICCVRFVFVFLKGALKFSSCAVPSVKTMTSYEFKENIQNTLMWDVSCNSQTVAYSNNMTMATAKESGNYKNIRGPFWESGRHIVNIRINKRGKDGM